MSHDPATFRISCGAASLLRLGYGRVGQPPEHVHTFEPPFVLVGRDPRNDLVLGKKAVSQRHAYLQVIRGRVFFLDLKSRLGTHLGAELRPCGWLSTEPLFIWPFAISVTDPQPLSEENLPNPLTRRTEESDGLPEVVLEVRNGTEPRDRWRMTRELALVGRQPNCKIHLVDSSVSAFHCSLVRTPQGLWVVDLLSRTGVQVNGVPEKWAPLADGDSLSIGQYTIHVQIQTPPDSGREIARLSDRSEKETPAVNTGVIPTLGASLPSAAASQPGLPQLPALLPLPILTGLAEAEGGLSGPVGASLIMTVLHNMQSMQQQMFDHYQQSLFALAEVFARMHGDQMESVRREVAQLRSLTDELHQLRAQLAAAGPGRAAVGPSGSAVRPVQPALAGPNGVPAAKENGGARGPQGVEAGTPGNSASTPPGEKPADGPQLHAWLNQRIDELQRERQGRWSKMLSFVLGQ